MKPDEEKLLAFIASKIEATGEAPTYREMRAHTGLQSNHGVALRIDRLCAKGHLIRDARVHRGLKLAGSPLGNIPTAELQAELARRERESER
jgi:SOS-response transcriptional repressor LexA